MTRNDPIKQPIHIPAGMSFGAGATFFILFALFYVVAFIMSLLPEAAIDVELNQYNDMYNDVRVTLSLAKDFVAPTLAFATVHSVRRVARHSSALRKYFL